MLRVRLLQGALLSAALLFSQSSPGPDPEAARTGEPRWFLLNESTDLIRRELGPPALVAEFGEDFLSWQYQIDNSEHDEFSHSVVFRKSDRSLVSITRNYSPERSVDGLFPGAETTVHHFPDAKAPQFSLRLRRLSGGRVLMAMGSPKQGQPTGQLVLMRESELRVFYPWLYQQLYPGKSSGR